MKDKKFLILFVFALIVGFLILYSSAPINLGKYNLSAKSGMPQKALISRLELQVQQLQNLIHSFVQLDLSLRKEFKQQQQEFTQERQKLESLREDFKGTISQNEGLIKKLTEARAGLELTQPIREQLKEIDDSLAAKPQQKKDLAGLLRSIEKRLSALDRSVPKLIKQNRSYKGDVQALTNLLDKKKQELGLLEQRMADVRNNTVRSLKQNNDNLSKKNSQLEKELQSLRAELEQINKERRIIIKDLENAEMASENTQGLKEQLTRLQAQLGRLHKDYADLKYDYSNAQAMLGQNETELGKRADKILTMQEELSEAEAKLGEIQSASKETKKESAVLREQYVAVQLEREGLKQELEQSMFKLDELQNKFKQIANIFNLPLEQSLITSEPEGKITEPPAKKVDVKLVPQIQPERENEEQTP